MTTTTDLEVRINARHTEATDICSFELVHPQGALLPAFEAGAHIDVALPNGLVRQYSLCNAPGERHRYLIAVLNEAASRGGSRALHTDVKVGDVLRISAPRNHFALTPTAQKSLLLAGGIGVTPLLCMAEQLAAKAASFEMHYCLREASRAAFAQRIAASSFATKVFYHFDNLASEQKLNLDAMLDRPDAATHLYVCGPKGFMDAVLGAARAKGWPEGQLHYEFFAAEVVHSELDQDFDVRLASSGQVVRISKNQTVVEALAQAGIEVDTSCEQGVCGTCLTRVLDGMPDHRDLYLTPEEHARNDQFLPCCSRAKSPMLVLDL